MKKYYRFARRKITRTNLKNLFLDQSESPQNKAFAMFIGIFIGVIPIWGMQVLSAIFSAKFFRVNKPIAVVGSYINVTPLFPVLVYFSLRIGAAIIGTVEVLPAISDISMATAKTYFWLYLVGCVPVAFITAFIFGLITYGFAVFYKYHYGNLKSVRV